MGERITSVHQMLLQYVFYGFFVNDSVINPQSSDRYPKLAKNTCFSWPLQDRACMRRPPLNF